MAVVVEEPVMEGSRGKLSAGMNGFDGERDIDIAGIIRGVFFEGLDALRAAGADAGAGDGTGTGAGESMKE
jgi:hypothetical protein